MNLDKRYEKPTRVIATWFGVGYLPKMPGTWGSLAALPLAWLITTWGNQIWLALFSVFLFLIGSIAANEFGKLNGNRDAPEIVIDEVAGQILTLSVIPPDILLYLVGFASFRFMDILKPWPINIIDNRIKNGFGVMLDDMIAAGYSICFLLFGIYYLGT